MITERPRYPLHTERIGDIDAWLEVGWIYCGEHPALPGWALLEWRELGIPVAPFMPRGTSASFLGHRRA